MLLFNMNITYYILQISILVNNAGISYRAPFLESSPHRDRSLLQLNVHAALDLTRAVAPSMVTRKQGRIVFVSSIAGY